MSLCIKRISQEANQIADIKNENEIKPNEPYFSAHDSDLD